MAQLNFNVKDAPEDNYEPLPAGTYAAHIVQSEMKETKAGNGMYLELRIQILDEPYTGRLVFDRLNLVNPNDTAVQIAQRTLAQICKACGLEEVEDSEEFHGIEMNVTLGIQEGSGNYGPSNVVKKYAA